MAIFSTSGSKRLLRTLAIVLGSSLTVAIGAPSANADDPSPQSPPGQHKQIKKVVRKTMTLADVQRSIGTAQVRRADGTVTSMAPQAIPNCLIGGTDGVTYYPDGPPSWEYVYEWWYDSSSRLTNASAAAWKAEVQCNNMNFISISSNLWFRNNPVSPGSYETCGTTDNSFDNGCGFRQTDGSWGCAGLGNCDGLYYETFGWTWILPGGWQWGQLPPTCTRLSSREALCLFSTPNFWIPFVN